MLRSSSGIDRAHYHGWQGRLRSPWWGALSVARVALWQIFRRKLYWIVIALGLAHFLSIFALVFFAAQLEANAGAKIAAQAPDASPAGKRARRAEGPGSWILGIANFTPQPDDRRDNGYLGFMERQSYIVLILLAFAGSLVVGSDFQHRGLAFYLSRGIDRWHYVLGKWLGLAGVISILTVLPALALFAQYGLYSSNLDYWLDDWWIPLVIVGYGLVMCLVLGISVMALSMYLRQAAPIAITCFSAFILLDRIGSQISEWTGNRHWRLLSPWRDMRHAARYCFDPYLRPEDLELGGWALAIIAAVCLVCVALLYRRVQAVEVVE
jgi:ABC-type transport system involved in multi-copper enzyme maturation permease subunit